MTLYQANWASEELVDALMDDGPESIDDIAEPHGIVLMDINEDTILALLERVYREEIVEIRDPDDNEDVPTGTWAQDEVKPSHGYRRTWRWTADGEPNPELCVIIREACL